MVKPLEKHSKVLSQPSRSQPSRVFHKTVLCKYFISHGCLKGQSCTFAHGDREKVPIPDLRYTQMCRALMQHGVCDDPECTYAHKKEDVRGMLTPPSNSNRAVTKQPEQTQVQPRQRARNDRDRHGNTPKSETAKNASSPNSLSTRAALPQPPLQPPSSNLSHFEVSDKAEYARTGGTMSLEPALPEVTADSAPSFWPSTQGDACTSPWKKTDSPEFIVNFMERRQSRKSTETGGSTGGSRGEDADVTWPCVYEALSINTSRQASEFAVATPDVSPLWYPAPSAHSGSTQQSSDADNPGIKSTIGADGHPCDFWPMESAVAAMTPDVSPLPWLAQRAATSVSSSPEGSGQKPTLHIFGPPQKFHSIEMDRPRCVTATSPYHCSGVFAPHLSGASTSTNDSIDAEPSPSAVQLNVPLPSFGRFGNGSWNTNLDRQAAAAGDVGMPTVNVKNTFLQFSPHHAGMGSGARRPMSLPPHPQ